MVAAVDVGFRAPHASTAGDDAAETMVQDKLAYYADQLEDLARQGIVYKPMIFTAYGRRHLAPPTCYTMRPRPWPGSEGLRTLMGFKSIGSGS